MSYEHLIAANLFDVPYTSCVWFIVGQRSSCCDHGRGIRIGLYDRGYTRSEWREGYFNRCREVNSIVYITGRRQGPLDEKVAELNKIRPDRAIAHSPPKKSQV